MCNRGGIPTACDYGLVTFELDNLEKISYFELQMTMKYFIEEYRM